MLICRMFFSVNFIWEVEYKSAWNWIPAIIVQLKPASGAPSARITLLIPMNALANTAMAALLRMRLISFVLSRCPLSPVL
jgi:hypothetical protein